MFAHLRFPFTLAIGAAILWSAAAAAADKTRYISIAGDNTNACTLAAPCRSLQHGIGATPAGGELQILDSGSYGKNGTIKKSLTLIGNGHTVYVGNPITIDGDGIVVALRGLSLNGRDAVQHGISVVNAATVHIERCVVQGFPSQGIASIAPDVRLSVLDSISRDNGGSGFNLFNSGAQQVTIDNSRFENNGSIDVFIQSGRATISRSIASGNAIDGIVAHIPPVTIAVRDTTAAYNGNNGFTARGLMTLDSSLAYGNLRGLSVSNLAGSLARVSNSTFTANGSGLVNSGGTLETRGNNTVKGNTDNDVIGALTPLGGV